MHVLTTLLKIIGKMMHIPINIYNIELIIYIIVSQFGAGAMAHWGFGVIKMIHILQNYVF
jgi:hypothetical protein